MSEREEKARFKKFVKANMEIGKLAARIGKQKEKIKKLGYRP